MPWRKSFSGLVSGLESSDSLQVGDFGPARRTRSPDCSSRTRLKRYFTGGRDENRQGTVCVCSHPCCFVFKWRGKSIGKINQETSIWQDVGRTRNAIVRTDEQEWR